MTRVIIGSAGDGDVSLKGSTQRSEAQRVEEVESTRMAKQTECVAAWRPPGTTPSSSTLLSVLLVVAARLPALPPATRCWETSIPRGLLWRRGGELQKISG